MNKFFYKYYTINQNLYNSIINNELYFSNPRNFNDPFDSLPRYEITEDFNKLKNFHLFIREYIITSLPAIEEFKDFKQLESNYKNLIETYLYTLKDFSSSYCENIKNFDSRAVEIYTFYNNPGYFEKAYELNYLELQNKMYTDFIFLTIDINRFGITCGSTKPSCPLMWGHYANSHTGICIKYELDDDLLYDKKELIEVLDIEYSDKPLNIFDYSTVELNDLKYKIFTTKYSKWGYENEIRIVSKQGLIKINKLKIQEVIFGYKSSPKDRFSLLRLFACLGYKIDKLSMAKILPNAYELDIQHMVMNDITGSGVYLSELNLDRQSRNLIKDLI